MSTQLGDATDPTGTQAFLKSLQASGITSATDVELRYIGTAPDGYLDVTKRLTGDVFGAAAPVPPAPPSGSSMSSATLGAIIGGVCGGVVLFALVAALFVSYRRKGKKQEREALTNQWKMERQLAESEKIKLAAAGAAGALGPSGSLRRSAAHDAGMVAMTRDDLERQRSQRRAESSAIASDLAARREAPTPPPPAKGSKLDSMRAALGLNKLTSMRSKKGSSGSAGPSRGTPTPRQQDDDFALNLPPLAPPTRSSDAVTPPPPAASRSFGSTSFSGAQRSSGPATGGSDSNAPAWGRMFSKK